MSFVVNIPQTKFSSTLVILHQVDEWDFPEPYTGQVSLIIDAT